MHVHPVLPMTYCMSPRSLQSYSPRSTTHAALRTGGPPDCAHFIPLYPPDLSDRPRSPQIIGASELRSIGTAASVGRESARLTLERLKLAAWCICEGTHPGNEAGHRALTSDMDLRPLLVNLLWLCLRMGNTNLLRCTVAARSVGGLHRGALLLSSTLYNRVLHALWSTGLYCRRVTRFDALLGRLVRLRSRLPWSRSPSTHTRPPVDPEGVTCADVGGPADTILDIPGNASAPGDAPLPLYALLTATLCGGPIRLCRPP